MTVATATQEREAKAAKAPPVPINERIAASLAAGSGADSTSLDALRKEAGSDYLALQGEEAIARTRSLDASVSVADARAARDDADDKLHEMRRLQAAIANVDAILPAMKSAEHKAAIMPAYIQYKLDRTKFMLRLMERYPIIAAEMVELLEGIEHYRHAPGVEIPEGEDPLRTDIELEVRGIGSFMAGHGFIPQLTHNRIASFTPRIGDAGKLWDLHKGSYRG